MAATKRVRVTEDAEDDVLTFWILDEPRPLNSSTGERELPSRYSFITFRVGDNSTFGQLWLQYPDVMLCREGEATPFIDLTAPLNDFDTAYLVKCDWTPVYDHMRFKLNEFTYKRIIDQLESDIQDMQEQLDYCISRKENYTDLLKEVQKKIGQ